MAVLGSNTLNHSADLFIQRAGTTRITVTSTGITVGGTLNGFTIEGASGNRFTNIPAIASNGVMEIGRYIDFHSTAGNTTDFTYRIDNTSNGNLAFSGNLNLTGTLTAGFIDAFGTTGGMSVNTQGSSKLEVRSSGAGNAAYMTFHIPGQFAVRAGLDTDNRFKVGGWSLGNVAYPVILGDLDTQSSQLWIRNTSPTIYLRDTDHNTAFIHCNSNIFYILRGGTDATTWTQVGGRWPFELNLTNNTAQFGGSIVMDQGALQVTGTRFRVNATGNDVQCSNIFNNGTTSGSNVHVRGTDFLMERNVSSIKYKHSVETLDDDISDYVIKNLRPVWYRSKCANDTPDWSWYGFIAEEVAEIEPRLCHWDVPIIEEETDEYYQPEPYTNASGELITPDPVKIVRKYQDPNAPKEVEGVMYERFTVLLVDQVQKLITKIETLEARVLELEAS